jgi:hypothetical protein
MNKRFIIFKIKNKCIILLETSRSFKAGRCKSVEPSLGKLIILLLDKYRYSMALGIPPTN